MPSAYCLSLGTHLPKGAYSQHPGPATRTDADGPLDHGVGAWCACRPLNAIILSTDPFSTVHGINRVPFMPGIWRSAAGGRCLHGQRICGIHGIKRRPKRCRSRTHLRSQDANGCHQMPFPAMTCTHLGWWPEKGAVMPCLGVASGIKSGWEHTAGVRQTRRTGWRWRSAARLRGRAAGG